VHLGGEGKGGGARLPKGVFFVLGGLGSAKFEEKGNAKSRSAIERSFSGTPEGQNAQ